MMVVLLLLLLLLVVVVVVIVLVETTSILPNPSFACLERISAQSARSSRTISRTIASITPPKNHWFPSVAVVVRRRTR